MGQKKNIWIVNYYTVPPQYVSNPRHIKIAKYLIEKGFDVTIITASNYCDNAKFITNGNKFEERFYDGIRFIHIKVLNYGTNNRSLKRILSIFQFSYKVLLYRNKFKKPDLIYQNIHNPFDYLISKCVKRFKCKYIVEAWDLWPEGMIKEGLINVNNPLTKLAYHYEHCFYKKADSIIFTMEGGEDYFRRHRWSKDIGGDIDLNKFYNINNGVDLKEFYENIVKYPVEDPDLDNPDLFKAVYVGSINLCNNVKFIIQCAEALIKYKDIKFLIYGDGYERIELESYCNKNNLTNVVFKEKRIPFNFIPSILSKCSLNLLNYRKASGKMGYSSGKMFLYFASGKPICSNIEPNPNQVKEYNLGVSNTFKNAKEYADAILSIYRMPKSEYNAMCSRVKEVAKLYDYPILCEKILQIINKTLQYDRR